MENYIFTMEQHCCEVLCCQFDSSDECCSYRELCLGGGGGDSCCSPDRPCLFGEGPCSEDEDCAGTAT